MVSLMLNKKPLTCLYLVNLKFLRWPWMKVRPIVGTFAVGDLGLVLKVKYVHNQTLTGTIVRLTTHQQLLDRSVQVYKLHLQLCSCSQCLRFLGKCCGPAS